MFFLAGGGLGLVVGLLLGGRFGELARLRFRWPLVVAIALVTKDAAFVSSLATSPFVGLIYVISLIALLAWTVWHWRRIPAIWLVSVGVAMNLMVVIANGGHMTVTRELALRISGKTQPIVERGSYGQYMVATADTHLNWLGDWISLPQPIHRFFPQAYSPGDLVMFVGMVLMLVLATRPRLLARALGPPSIAGRQPEQPGV